MKLNEQQHRDLLLSLSQRVTQRRHSLGLSLKDCALKAGFSARYLMQVEAAEANISLLKLQQLCIALQLRPAELISDGERGEIDQILSSLNQEQLRDALELLKVHFQTDKPVLISFLGVRGAGKSTLGLRLAQELNWPMIELDEEIERIAGLSLSELFAVHGEPYYRRLEGEVLNELQELKHSAIIATGGSIVTHHHHYALLKELTYTIYLKASAEEHMNRVIAQGDQRPMRDHPKAMSELKRLLNSRAHLYLMADYCLNTSQADIETLTQVLMTQLKLQKLI